MARSLLKNTFGFDTRCFVCDPENPDGMRQGMYLDDELNRIVCEFTPGKEYSGAPNYTHGGFVMALVDDAMAWAVIALKKRFGTTRKAEFEFLIPVMIGKTYELQAWVESMDGRDLIARAAVLNQGGEECVRGSAAFTVMTFQEAMQAIGAEAATAREYTEERA